MVNLFVYRKHFKIPAIKNTLPPLAHIEQVNKQAYIKESMNDARERTSDHYKENISSRKYD